MVTAIKGGYEVNLGVVGDNHARSLVKTSDVQKLLQSAAKHDSFKSAQSRYEFRLLERDGQAVLQLKKRTFASRYLNWIGTGSEERDTQRQEAMKAINLRYGLKLKVPESVSGTQARDFAKVQGQHLMQLEQAQAQGAVRLGQNDARTRENVLEGLTAMHESVVKEGEVTDASVSPVAGLFDKKTLGTLTRANVTVSESGTLMIGGTGRANAGPANLETVVKFAEDKSGISRDAPEFKTLLRNLTRNDHFVFAAKINDSVSQIFENKFLVNAAAINMTGKNQISFENGAFLIKQNCEGDMSIGGFDMNPNSFKAKQHVSAEQSFRLNVSDLTHPNFEIAKAAQDLQFSTNFD
jgi:hypothetical protein